MKNYLRKQLRYEALERRCVLATCPIVPDADFSVLSYSEHAASGEGDTLTTGSVDQTRELRVVDSSSWRVGHGVRIEGAGRFLNIGNPDWSASTGTTIEDVGPGSRDVDGSRIRNDMTSTDGKLVGLASAEIPSAENRFDALEFEIRTANDLVKGDLQITLSVGGTGPFELLLPDLPASSEWSKVSLVLESRTAIGDGETDISEILLAGKVPSVDIQLRDFELVSDFLTEVGSVEAGTLTLLESPRRTVTDSLVHHDDTVAVDKWLKEAQPRGAKLFAPEGIYNVSAGLELFSDSHISGAGRDCTLFRSTARSHSSSGRRLIFHSDDRPRDNVVVEHMGFDWNGWNARAFGSILSIRAVESPVNPSRNITIRHNRFFDSKFPGLDGADINLAQSATRQRFHVSIINVDGLLVEDNSMSHGGRIKAGSDIGRNMVIRDNVIDFVNDNGITIVSTEANSVTENVEITGNQIHNPINVGIFFGFDGEEKQALNGDTSRVYGINISNNTVTGFFGSGIKAHLPFASSDIRITGNTIEATRDRSYIEAAVDEEKTRGFTGIFLDGFDDSAPATDNFITGNSVIARGPFGRLDVGIRLRRNQYNTTVVNNQIACVACEKLETGIEMHRGNFYEVTISNNRVDSAGIAFELGRTDQRMLTRRLLIEQNEFLNSTNPTGAQIWLNVGLATDENLDDLVDAKIVGNRIVNGAGHGIRALGPGAFHLEIEQNHIENHGADGISLLSGAGTKISQYSIFDVGDRVRDIAIDLGDNGVTVNDIGDLDEGPNRLHNKPTLNFVTRRSDRIDVQGTAWVQPGGSTVLEFFANGTNSQEFLGDAIVNGRPRTGESDLSSEEISFTVPLPLVSVNASVVATATDEENNTSEFSDELLTLPGLIPDFDLDNVIGFSDFLVLSFNFGRTSNAGWSDGDLDEDGSVGFSDFLLLSSVFGQTTGRPIA